jgi:hypothetical protein
MIGCPSTSGRPWWVAFHPRYERRHPEQTSLPGFLPMR